MRINLRRILQSVLLAGVILPTGYAQTAPEGSLIPPTTLSPNGRFGVTVPITPETDFPKGVKNSVIDVKSGRLLAAIDAETGWSRMNHRSVLPARWSPDSALLLWEVDGKWSPAALVLICFGGDQIKWQSNVLAAAQKAILTRTQKAAPAKYAEAKEANKGNGSAYPEGFTVDVEALDPIAFPLRVRVALTSNPKEIPDLPTLESHLEGIIDLNGEFTVTQFDLGPGESSHF